MSSSLATEYRPRSFDDVVGQDTVVSMLRSMVARQSLPQQILFSGPSGTGKTTLARLTASAAMCSTPIEDRDHANPCGTCERCQRILSPDKTHPDVIEIDAASHGRVDEIRELGDIAQLMPAEAPKRIFIVDEIHGLSGAGGQAFLKLLEEPPEHVMFLAATTDPDKMLTTNRSRVAELPLRRPDVPSLVKNLQRVAHERNWDLPDSLAEAVVTATDGALGVRGTLMTLQKISPALDDGEVPLDVAYDILGAAEPALIQQVWSSVLNGDTNAIVEQYEGSASRVSDQAILRAVTSKAADAVTTAGRNNPAALPAAAKLHTFLIAAARANHPVETVLLQAAVLNSAAPSPSTTPPPKPTLHSTVNSINPATALIIAASTRVVHDEQSHVVTLEGTAETLSALRHGDHGKALLQAASELGVQLRPKATT